MAVLWCIFFFSFKLELRWFLVHLIWNFVGTVSLWPWVVAVGYASSGLCVVVVVVVGCSCFREERERDIEEE